MEKRGWVAVLVTAVVIGALVIGVVVVANLANIGMRDVGRFLGQVDEPGPRPEFALPFACGEQWRLSTYAGHNPDDKKVDMYRLDGDTEGGVVRASADGVVDRLTEPGGVKIDHGGRWYTLYLHMTDIRVEQGEELTAGQPIGRVGAVGTSAAHLHYEQINDANGDGWASTPGEIVTPVIQGERYELAPNQDAWPELTSTNSCG